jgi:hypothetical protein
MNKFGQANTPNTERYEMSNKTQSEQKEYYQKRIGVRLENISNAIARAVQIQKNMRAELDELRKKDDILFDQTNPGAYYDKTEFRIKNPGFYRDQEQKIKQKAATVLERPCEAVIEALEDLAEAAAARHSIVSIDDPRLSAAIAIIQASGAGIDFYTAKSINAQFEGDQNSLATLKNIYASHDCKNDGGIDGLIYNLGNVMNTIRINGISRAFQPDGLLNVLADKIAIIAAGEGFKFDPKPDDNGLIATFSKITGISEQELRSL